jgi:hypothetical protein
MDRESSAAAAGFLGMCWQRTLGQPRGLARMVTAVDGT